MRHLPVYRSSASSFQKQNTSLGPSSVAIPHHQISEKINLLPYQQTKYSSENNFRHFEEVRRQGLASDMSLVRNKCNLSDSLLQKSAIGHQLAEGRNLSLDCHEGFQRDLSLRVITQDGTPKTTDRIGSSFRADASRKVRHHVHTAPVQIPNPKLSSSQPHRIGEIRQMSPGEEQRQLQSRKRDQSISESIGSLKLSSSPEKSGEIKYYVTTKEYKESGGLDCKRHEKLELIKRVDRNWYTMRSCVTGSKGPVPADILVSFNSFENQR